MHRHVYQSPFTNRERRYVNKISDIKISVVPLLAKIVLSGTTFEKLT